MMRVSGLSRQAKLEFHYLNNKDESQVWNLNYLGSSNWRDLITLSQLLFQ